MKTACRTLLVSLCLCTGCVWLPKITEEPAPKQARPQAVKSRRTPAYVTAEQVNEMNAREMGQALAEELDRAQGLEKPGKEE